MKPTRTLITLAALTLGAWAADRGVGRWLLDRSPFSELPLPPFGRVDAGQRAELEEQLLAIEGGARPGPLQGFDSELGWCNRTGRSASKDIVIGTKRTRGERHYPVEPRGLRLACFGTSFVFGSEVADGETWCAQLEALDPSIEAMNFGVGGYGTDQALLRMRREGIHKARAVLMGLCLENIGRNVNRYRPLYSPVEGGFLTKPRFLLRAGELELLPQPYATRRELILDVLGGHLPGALCDHEFWLGDDPRIPASLISQVLAAGPAHRRRLVHQLWMDPGGEPYQTTMALVEAFREEALQAGADRFLLLVFARRTDLSSYRGYGQKYWGGLLEDLAERGIDHIDMAARLMDEEPREYYRRVHLSPAGNAVVAEEVHGWIGRQAAETKRRREE